MEEGIIELDDVLVAELMEDVDLNSKVGELLQIYGIKDSQHWLSTDSAANGKEKKSQSDSVEKI